MALSTYDDEKRQDEREVEMIERSIDPAATDGLHEEDLSILETIKANPKVLLYCILVCTGPLIFGYDSIIVGVSLAIPSFQKRFGDYILVNGVAQYNLPPIWLALWNAFTSLGIMFGSAINGPLTDRFGRKASFNIGGIIGCVAIASVYFSDRIEDLEGRRGTFLAGKIILGLSLGILQATCQTYVSEIAPPRIRGPLLSIFQFFLVLGQIVGVAIVDTQIKVVGNTTYRPPFASQWAFTGLAIVISLVIPESPVYCMKRNNVNGARKSFARIFDASTVDTRIVALQRTLEYENIHCTQGISYLDCFKGTNWRRTRIVLYANLIQQLLGITMVSNATYFLQLAGMSPNSSVMVLLIGVCLGLPANVISWFTMTIFGRRSILLTSSAWVGICWLTIGVAGCINNATSLWYIGVMLNMIIFFFGLGVGGTYPVVAAESSLVRLRAKTNSLGFIMNGFAAWVFGFFVPYLYNVGKGNANWGGKVGFFFGGLSLIAVVIIYLEIPEMKNRTYAELDEMFEGRLKTRQFKKYLAQDASSASSPELAGFTKAHSIFRYACFDKSCTEQWHRILKTYQGQMNNTAFKQSSIA